MYTVWILLYSLGVICALAAWSNVIDQRKIRELEYRLHSANGSLAQEIGRATALTRRISELENRISQ